MLLNMGDIEKSKCRFFHENFTALNVLCISDNVDWHNIFQKKLASLGGGFKKDVMYIFMTRTFKKIITL